MVGEQPVYAFIVELKNENPEKFVHVLPKALKGGHYNRAKRIYKLFYETLLKLLINHGKEKGLLLPDAITSLLDTICDTERTPGYFAFPMLQVCEEFDFYIERLFDMNQPENHMAMYILSLRNMIEILFMNLDNLRTNNWEAFLSSLRLMMPWMIIYDQTNYANGYLFFG